MTSMEWSLRWSLRRAFALCVTALLVAPPESLAQRYPSETTSCRQRYTGKPQRCAPPFVNAAFGRRVEATNTCGERMPTHYCLQTGVTGATKSCYICDSRDNFKEHPARYLTDLNNNDNRTWWQSETMLENMQYPSTVNLTLHLGHSFDITYVRLRFYSSRPESFAIYKRTTEESPWIPYQFYSASCQKTYAIPLESEIESNDEAICTDDFSDISPLTGGSIAFSTLQDRPSKYDFETSLELQNWVAATSIRIVLTRMNTFGDEVFGDQNVLKSYFYAISDFAVGGICQCNGHASECTASTGRGLRDELVCLCQHNTTGPTCEQCKPFYNDRPWQRATQSDAVECLPCNCNGLSSRCFFDEELFRRTGHGGHCLDCTDNTAGPNCERCKDFFFQRSPAGRCESCGCDATGSLDEQCDDAGTCRCKPGVGGPKCDRCLPNYYGFISAGCRSCACSEEGSRGDNPSCNVRNGQCDCKTNVENLKCDRCKPGYFNLDERNPHGCQSCFCYGHSSICSSAPGFAEKTYSTLFNNGKQHWKGVNAKGESVPLEFDGLAQRIGLKSTSGGQLLYFAAPDRFLADQVFSYNRRLRFSLRTGNDHSRASRQDLIVEGNGLSVTTPIYSQNNPVPRSIKQSYSFLLNEHIDNMWYPQLTAAQFLQMLSNLTAVKIRAVYSSEGVGFLDDVKLESARQGGRGKAVTSIEQCDCPDGYIGQFCESCAPGFHRDPPSGGTLARCIACNCNGHSDACDVNTGTCICQHNTAGQNCQHCASGYYGNALQGGEDDCMECPCRGGDCAEMWNGEVACTNCKEGYTGNRCDICADGYFGNKGSENCQKCNCNGNIDPNAINNCDSVTGECLKCVHNTRGFYCESCLSGNYGDPLKGECEECQCHKPGVGNNDDTCDQESGQCRCLAHVIGRQCETCEDGFWNINSGAGCERCRCDRQGSVNQTCDISTGQCFCKPGVMGMKCDLCMPLHFGFSYAGCQRCDCDEIGSTEAQCDIDSGHCSCRNNIEGRQCDRCVENKYDIGRGCVDCPICYNLVQDAVAEHRKQLDKLRDIIRNIGRDPGAINDTNFRRRLTEIQNMVDELLSDARVAIGADGPLSDQFKQISASVETLKRTCDDVANDLSVAGDSSSTAVVDVSAAERAIDIAEKDLRDTEDFLESEGRNALGKAKEAQEKFGQQSKRMTAIAKEARQLALKHSDEADQIEQTADQALNTSREALQVARDALDKPWQTARDIQDLKRAVNQAESLYDETKLLAERSQESAKTAYEQSLKIFADVKAIAVPEVDTNELHDRADRVKAEADEIIERARGMMEQQRALIEEVARKRISAQNQLQQGTAAQQVADELLSHADYARTVALKAIEMAEQTLREANGTLRTLEEFDKKVKDSKAMAEEALKKVPQIEEQIGAAERRTSEAQDNLQNAKEDAFAARDIAAEAKDTAATASAQAQQIKEQTREQKQRAQNLKDDADEIDKEIGKVSEIMETYEIQAVDDQQKVEQALEKAEEAKKNALESSASVSQALRTVHQITSILDNLESIDEATLDELETSLGRAEEALEQANLDRRYENLIAARSLHMRWIEDSTSELIELAGHVRNVQRINATIPRRCFNRIKLEPTAPDSSAAASAGR